MVDNDKNITPVKIKTNFIQTDTINKFLLAALGFFIPISTAAINILLALIFLVWVAGNISHRFDKNLLILKSNIVALVALMMFLIYLVGVLYSNAETGDILEYLRDGAKYFFIPMTMIYFKDKKFASLFLPGFISAMIIVLVLSFLLWFDMLPDTFPVTGSQANCTIFNLHITQNIFMAYTAFVFAVWAKFSDDLRLRFVWGALSFAAIFNVFCLVQGRTGHIVLLVLIGYFFLAWSSKKSIISALVFILFSGIVLWLNPSNALFSRAERAIKEAKAWEYGKPADGKSSTGLRLELYTNTLQLIKDNPIFGTGTGSFKKRYNAMFKNTNMNKADNPHNDYLMFTVQFGIIGLISLLGFFMIQWKYARFLKEKQYTLLSRGYILTILCSCMVSSPLTDSAEGWFFAFMCALFFSNIEKPCRKNCHETGLDYFKKAGDLT